MEVVKPAAVYNSSDNNPNKDPNKVRGRNTNAEAVEEVESEPEQEPEGSHVDRKAEGQKSNNIHFEGHYGNLEPYVL